MKKSYILFLLLLIFILTLSVLFTSCQKNDDDNEVEHMHLYNQTVVQPTCKEGGYTTKTCSSCGDTVVSDYTAQTNCSGNTWTVIKEATCTQAGEQQLKCTTCARVISTESIPMLEHQPITELTQAPSCIHEGIRTTVCGICDKKIKVENIPPIETHSYEITVIPPTESEQGKTLYICKICSHSESGNYLDKLTSTTATQIYEKASKATVRVEAYDKAGKLSAIGTGFFYTNDGNLITNYHVIATAYTVKIVFYDGQSYDVSKILGYNIAQDVAILKVNKTSTEYLEISTEKPKTGDTVYALGNPLGVNNIFTFGMVSNEKMTISGKECIAFTAPISPGNSGGPLMNSNGEVVGINSMYIPDAQNLNFAIFIDKATSLNLNNPITTQTQYTTNLKQNAYDILASYISHNCDYTSDDIYVIETIIEEEGENIGLEFSYIYDSDSGSISIEALVVDNAQYKYALTIYLNQDSTIFDVSMYDFEANQYTIEAKIDVSKSNVDYQNSFWLFSIGAFRYDPTETDKNENRKQFFYALYCLTTQEFKSMLQKSYTGLTISSFFTNWTYNQ